MTLIPFPNVPNVPGVPQLARVAGTMAGVVAIVKSYGGFPGQDKQWQILDQSGRAALTPDSVISFDYQTESTIATHPVELGQFASYNKVRSPKMIRITMTCSGTANNAFASKYIPTSSMTKQQFLDKLEEMKESTDLYNIVSPDNAYNNFNLVHFDYERKSSKGFSLLTVSATFQEVVTTAVSTYVQTATPSGAAKVSTGRVNPASAPAVSVTK